jgi:gas vesicle protein
MRSKQVILGMLAGIATGALLGILLSPAKGSETRKKLSVKRDDYTRALKAKFNEYLDGFIEKVAHDVSGSDESGKPSQAKPQKKRTPASFDMQPKEANNRTLHKY